MSDQVRFNCWARCSTCRDAKRFLERAGIQFTERDFFSDRFTAKELEELARIVPIDGLFSWASPSARPYKEGRGQLAQAELIKLMVDEPRLVRRPILVKGDRVLVGFKRDEWQAAATEG